MVMTQSLKLAQRSLEQLTYKFQPLPNRVSEDPLPLYINAPFYSESSSPCREYTVPFSEHRKSSYLDALIKEIALTSLGDRIEGLFFRGVLPDLLATPEIQSIVEALRWKVDIDRIGIEMSPRSLTSTYIQDLHDIGFKHLSLEVMRTVWLDSKGGTEKPPLSCRRFDALVSCADSLGLWVNAKVCLNLPDRSKQRTLEMIRNLADMPFSQLTLCPFLCDTLETFPPPQEQFQLVERVGTLLSNRGYRRVGVWAFARTDEVHHDFLWEGLLGEHIALGPGSISAWDDWWVVKPALDAYLSMIETRDPMGFVGSRSLHARHWLGFGRALYRLNSEVREESSALIRLLAFFMEISGYVMDGKLTIKGLSFAHELSRILVRAFPSPLTDTECVENYGDYRAYSEAEAVASCCPSTSMLST